jgi:lipopolysaccharide heptosyltransferase II
LQRSQIRAMRSILVIRFSSLGDVILTTPIVRQLQQTYPRAIIDVAVASRFAGVYEHNPRIRTQWLVDPTPEFDDGDADAVKLAMHENVKGGRYDLVVDLQNNVRSNAFRRGLGERIVSAPKYRLQKLALVWLKQKPSTIVPIVERYREPLSDLPLVMDTHGPEVWLADERLDGAYAPHVVRRSTNGTTHIVLAPGAHHATKRWPVARFAELAAMLVRQGARVSLVGGPADVAICDAVAAASGVDLIRADGATSVEQTIRVLDASDVLVTNDSGVMHLGAARRIPIVAIFGSTVKELGFAPYGVKYRMVEHDVGCRPCSHIGKSRCPRGHFMCMEGIKVEEVHHAIQRLI